MPTKKATANNNNDDDQLLELAFFGLAVGITVGAVALYLKSLKEKNQSN
jgi:uncharacterized membrane-anchored protein YhcB (DUF1043 family)